MHSRQFLVLSAVLLSGVFSVAETGLRVCPEIIGVEEGSAHRGGCDGGAAHDMGPMVGIFRIEQSCARRPGGRKYDKQAH